MDPFPAFIGCFMICHRIQPDTIPNQTQWKTIPTSSTSTIPR